MPPPSPLPQRFGLNAAWIRTPDRDPLNPTPWPTFTEWLTSRLGEFIDVQHFLDTERFVKQSGVPVTSDEPYSANTFVWYHRDLRDEPEVPGSIDIVYRDERIIVVDKPPFLSTIPRGRHVRQSVVVKLRDQLGLPELTPAHRLDRITSGLLLLTAERKWRASYQMLFQDQLVVKRYLALAPNLREGVDIPVTVSNHLKKYTGTRRVQLIEDAAPNSESLIEMERPLGQKNIYRLTPHTGKTHQLRQHMLTLGAPISGDPLYPEILSTCIDDFTVPLQLLAHSLTFTDPVDGTPRHYESSRVFPIEAPISPNDI